MNFCIFLENLLRHPENILLPFAQFLQCNLNSNQICEIKSRHKKPLQTALYFLSQEEKFKKIKFNIPAIDEITYGGIIVRSITEIFGEAGSGKSQICMQLAINVQLPEHFGGLNGKCVYVSTDKRIETRRLDAMAKSVKKVFANSPEVQEISFLDNIFVEEFNTIHEFQSFVYKKLPRMLELHPDIKLVVIDSIAGIFRIETSFMERANLMRVLALKLEILSDLHNFVIIATNHITASSQETGESETAALGTTWESMVGIQLNVKNTSQYSPSRVRKIEVVSSGIEKRSAKFLITGNGLAEVELSRIS